MTKVEQRSMADIQRPHNKFMREVFVELLEGHSDRWPAKRKPR